MNFFFVSLLAFFLSLSSLVAQQAPVLPVGVGHLLYSAGNFAPILKVTPHPDRYPAGAFLVLMPDETTALITFDASRSYHPEGKPLLYRWKTLESEQMEPLPGTTWSASPYLTVPWYPNSAEQAFYVNVVEADADLQRTGGRLGKAIGVTLMSPSRVMGAMRESIDDSFDRPRDTLLRRALLPTLDLAAQQFRREEREAAIKTLQLFQRRVKGRLQTLGTEYGETLIRLSQAVIDNVRMKYPAPAVSPAP